LNVCRRGGAKEDHGEHAKSSSPGEPCRVSSPDGHVGTPVPRRFDCPDGMQFGIVRRVDFQRPAAGRQKEVTP
jgi:hypothetical protein